MVCLVVIIVFSMVNSHYLIGYTIDSNGYCNVRRYKWYEANYSRLNVVYLLSYSIIPFTIITICNLFIVLSVCHNKTNMKKKYEIKKPILSSNIHHELAIIPQCLLKVSDKTINKLEFDQYSKENDVINKNKHDMFTSIKDKKITNDLLDSNCKFLK